MQIKLKCDLLLCNFFTIRTILFATTKQFSKRTLQSNVQLQSLLQLQRDYSSAYIDLSQEHAQLLQEILSDKRLDSSEEGCQRGADGRAE